jgi:hypothetical protein
MSHTRLTDAVVRRSRVASLLPLVVVLIVGAAPLPAPRLGMAEAQGQERPVPDHIEAVHRPLHNMVEGYAEGSVVAIEYLQTYYCPTTPSSDLDPPFGRGDGHPQAEDPTEYQVPPCFFGDTGTGSILPAHLQAGAFPGVKAFFGLAPWFGGSSASSKGPPTALGLANGPASDVDTQCAEPGPPITEHRGQAGTCLMHPSTLRFAKVFEDPGRQPPDPVAMPQHSHLLPEAAAAPGWWNIVGVEIYDRAIWPDHDGDCPAGPPRCVTSVPALRAAQESGQASAGVPSNLYWYLSVHPIQR